MRGFNNEIEVALVITYGIPYFPWPFHRSLQLVEQEEPPFLLFYRMQRVPEIIGQIHLRIAERTIDHSFCAVDSKVVRAVRALEGDGSG